MRARAGIAQEVFNFPVVIEAWDEIVELRWQRGEWRPYTLMDSGRWANACGGMGADLANAKIRVMDALRYGYRDNWEHLHGEMHIDHERDMICYEIYSGPEAESWLCWKVQAGDGRTTHLRAETPEAAFEEARIKLAED